jgi:hypothetical protein
VWLNSLSTKSSGNQTTKSNNPPQESEAIFPTSGQKDIDTSFTLKWESSDEDKDDITYNVYLDTVTPPLNLVEKDLKTE